MDFFRELWSMYWGLAAEKPIDMTPRKPIDPRLDASLRNGVTAPSAPFRKFVYQFFEEHMIYFRREYDLTLLDQLSGLEREIAIKMILVNLAKSGWVQFVDAAIHLDLKDAVPVLLRKFEEEPDNYAFAKALLQLGAANRDDVFLAIERALPKARFSLAHEIFGQVNSLFPPEEASKLIELGLRSNSSDVRAAANKAAGMFRVLRDTRGPRGPQ